MRRKFLSVVLCVCMMLTMAPFAFAEGDDGTTTEIGAEGGSSNTSSGGSGGTTLQDQINAIGSTGTITLNRTYTEDVTIPANKNITLNLNGQTLKNVTTNTITVENGATLTVTGTGTVDNITHGKAVLYNKGTVFLEGGTFERSAEAGIDATNNGGNSYYTVLNHGSMTVKSNVTVNNKGHYSSLFENGYFDYTKTQDGIEAPSLIIDGGKFDGGLNTIKNDDNATLTINDGTFINYTQAAFQNHHIATINGGTFTATDANAVLNCGVCSEVNSDHDDHVITIKNGTFTGAINCTVGSISISGGTYSVDVSDFCAEGYYSVKDREKYTVKPLNEVAVAKIGDNLYTSLSAAISAASDGQAVTLLKNTTENVNISAEQSVAINLNGYTVTVPSDCGIELQGKLTVTGNGKITCANTPICVDGNSAELTVNDGTIESTNDYGIYAKNGGSVVVNGGTISSKNAALSGNNTTGSMNFTVNSGTLTAAQGPAIYMPGQVSLNISGGTLNGGVSLRMGQVNISGGVINAMTDVQAIDMPTGIVSGKPAYTYSGNVWFPDALYVIGGTYTSENTTYHNSLNLNITGGTFNCANGKGSAVAIYDLAKVEQTASVEISGNAKFSTNASDRSAYQVLSLTDLGVENPAEGYNQENFVGKVSSSISGGYFTTDPSAYCVNGKTGISSGLANYPWTVCTKSDTKAEVASGDPAVKDPTAVPKTDADKNLLNATQTALASAEINGNGIDAAAADMANKNMVTADASVVGSLNTAIGTSTPATTENTNIVIQTYMDMQITGVSTENDKKSITVDIQPMYRTVATTANVKANEEIVLTSSDSAKPVNAVQIGTPKPLSITGETTITIQLPTGFINKVGDSYPPIYVQHKGHEYTATVTESDGKLIAIFTNPDGFSPFTISTESTAVATIGDNRYTTLQDAVDAVKDGETIIVTGDNLSATVSGSKTFKVTGQTVNLSAASGYSLTNNGDTYTVSHQSSGGPGSSGGSISTPTTYAVNVNAATNGAVAADKKTASKGTTVTVTASPSKGYVVDAVKVVDKDGKDVAVTEKDGKYVFTMPGSAVTVTGTFKAETPAPVALPFTDVKSGNWFYDAVKYAYAQGLMTGTSATTFAPNGTMNRAMIVTVLYRLEKSPAVTGASKFTDVPAGQWYSDAVAWAAANKIVNGYDETTFGPMNAVTREQMAAILFRYEQVKGLENVTLEENLNRFPDQNKISAYAIPALQWAVGQKIINGNADGTLDPTGTATRAQVAQIFTNLLNK